MATGLFASTTFVLTADWTWTLTNGAAARPSTPLQSPGEDRATDPETFFPPASGPAREEASDEELLARWEALRSAFVEVAAPVSEALERVDRLRDELPEWQARAQAAEAAYLRAKRARERAERNADRYVEEVAKVEQKIARDQVVAAERSASQAETKLEELQHTRERLAAAWARRASNRDAAEAAAADFFDKYVREGEIRVLRAEADLNQRKALHDRLTRYGHPKQAKALHAEVESHRAEELASLAAWEKAKAMQLRLEGRLAKSDLSPAEKRLFDRLVEIVAAASAGFPRSGDPAEFRAFLDQFEARLAQAQAISTRLRMRRYDGLVNQLLEAHERQHRD